MPVFLDSRPFRRYTEHEMGISLFDSATCAAAVSPSNFNSRKEYKNGQV
jgi:hypothetical protein